MTRPEPSSVERLAAAAFYAPIGLGAHLVDDLPATLQKAKQQIVLARFIGKMAVNQGAKQLRDRLTSEPAPNERRAAPSTSATKRSPAPTSTPVADVESLALPDYDQLPAAHIVGKLEGLTQAERDVIEAYEAAGRHRRTVLGKLAQLKVD